MQEVVQSRMMRTERAKRTVTQKCATKHETNEWLSMSAKRQTIHMSLTRQVLSQRMCVEHVGTRKICVCATRFVRTTRSRKTRISGGGHGSSSCLFYFCHLLDFCCLFTFSIAGFARYHPYCWICVSRVMDFFVSWSPFFLSSSDRNNTKLVLWNIDLWRPIENVSLETFVPDVEPPHVFNFV